MTEAWSSSSTRPTFASQDTFDSDQLVGKLSRNGIAALRPGQASAALRSDPSLASSGASTPAAEHDGSGNTTASPSGSAVVSDDDSEDYDRIKVNPDTIVDGGRRGGLDASRSDHDLPRKISEKVEHKERRQSEPFSGKPSPPMRRKSIQVRLEKTDKKGRYVLTADDPEIRELLRKGIEREEASTDPSKRPRNRFRDVLFTRQWTTFDRQNPLSSESPFHGFFTLFWLAMILMFFRVAAHNYRDYGSIFGRNEIMKLMFGSDVLVLGIMDLTICLATSFGLFLHKAIYKGYLSWSRSGWIIQNIWQSTYLATVVWWIWYRNWPWTHTIFIVLHTMVFLMKQHSYAFYNGYLSTIYRRQKMLKDKLQKLHELRSTGTAPSSPTGGMSFPSSGIDLTSTSQGNDMKLRRQSLGPRTSTTLDDEMSDVARVAAAIDASEPLNDKQMDAFERIIAAEVEDCEKILCGKSTSGENKYPKNLTLANWADWTCLPTLVYELEYPRLDKINWWYVVEKTAATFGVIAVMMVISQAYIYPPVAHTVRMKEAGVSLEERWHEFPWIALDMLFPLLLEQLLSWYVIWECVLNVLAELTKFADRGFYGDWWNSVSWDQYARDWNRPVHNFLLRHVYHSSISTFHLSKSTATFVTFLLSALVHELVMACLFRKVRGYLFTMQLLQMPLVSLSRTKLLKGRNLLGNIIFWIGLFVGPSVLTSFYLLI
ncbi:Sterol O-acyltransferase 2 (Sterol-ester synthase 2) [Zalaria obscura]|uniref:Sterol O-acyltransferase 2 (Sterol-ester synthase 2) n=1 Tax=Zalaria obscura TaxID=2024903 RepID=A0ACC3SBQ4_9PEZI